MESNKLGSMSSSSRLNMISGHLTATKAKIMDDVWATVNGDEFLSEKGIALRKKTRDYMTSIESKLIQYQNTTEFPFELVDGIRQLGVNGFHIKEFGGPGLNTMEVGAIIYEMAKIDASIYTFLTVHNSIGMAVVDYLGSEEQRARILPDGIALKKILSFGLTEPDFGSDATSLRTTAKKVDGGYVINGEKRWIGNATFADIIIIWAKNVDDGNKIQAFMVEKGSKGLTTKKI
jgi:alkylation response protein AidB-like acyl-CoA dehydrogenase